ncbi:MAG: zinc-binding dehydrogenase [Acidimicrobiia bacterium]
MKAVELVGERRLQSVERPVPRPGAGQVLITVEQCGLCTGEVDLWLGKDPETFPVPIGHEIGGVIEEVGPEVSGMKPGDRVSAWIEGGGFATHVIARGEHCVRVAPTVSYPAVAEPLSCVVNAVELAAPALADNVVIVGAGYMGILLQLVVSLKGARSITVVDTRADALDRAKALGATGVVQVPENSAQDFVRDLTGGSGADVTFEVTGVNAGLDLAGDLTRMEGKLVIVGYHQGERRSIDLAHWNWMAFEILNAHFRSLEKIMTGMKKGIALVNSGLIDPEPLVTNWFTLDQLDDAFALGAAKPVGYLKSVVTTR